MEKLTIEKIIYVYRSHIVILGIVGVFTMYFFWANGRQRKIGKIIERAVSFLSLSPTPLPYLLFRDIAYFILRRNRMVLDIRIKTPLLFYLTGASEYANTYRPNKIIIRPYNIFVTEKS